MARSLSSLRGGCSSKVLFKVKEEDIDPENAYFRNVKTG
jgi:hypothetical protein